MKGLLSKMYAKSIESINCGNPLEKASQRPPPFSPPVCTGTVAAGLSALPQN